MTVTNFSFWMILLDKKLENQKPTGMVAEIQHLPKKYNCFWVSLWYLNVYITPDTDWMILILALSSTTDFYITYIY